MEDLVSSVQSIYQEKGRCVLAVSEGITAPDGELWAKKAVGMLEKDDHGNVTLSGTGVLVDFLVAQVRQRCPDIKRMRGDTFGYLQRCFPGVVSKTDAQEARMVGKQAVHYATDWAMDGSVAIRRLDKPPGTYSTETFLTPLSTVAAKTKLLPKEFCDTPGQIKDAFLDYARPLVGDLPVCQKL